MFQMRGAIDIVENISDEQELQLIDAGLIDIERPDSGSTLLADREHLQPLVEVVKKLSLTVEESALRYIPKEKITPRNEAKLIALLDALDDLDDVDNVYTNADV